MKFSNSPAAVSLSMLGNDFATEHSSLCLGRPLPRDKSEDLPKAIEEKTFSPRGKDKMSIVILSCIVSFIVSSRWRTAAPKLYFLSALGAFLLLFSPVSSLSAQDTIHELNAIDISTTRPPSTIRTATPTQVMDIQHIESRGAIQLSDAVRQMAGITMKDYGGVGGMKTVSVRGLGSQFSTLTIDGVAVNNAQNGQVDLGRYLLGNAAYVSLSQGHTEDDLLSARAYSSGNVISLVSAEPSFFLAEKDNLKTSLDVGSFGLLSPSILWDHKWHRRLKTSLWINYLKSNGNYPFTLFSNIDHTGPSKQLRRTHSETQMFTSDASLFFTIAPQNTITAKIHLMNGLHQLPGYVLFYSTVPSAQSTHETELFSQIRWRKETSLQKIQILTKLSFNSDIYEDSNAISAINHYINNTYRQHEAYLSSSYLRYLTPFLDLSLAADASLSFLRSNLSLRNNVNRNNLAVVTNLRLHFRTFEANAHLLATSITDHVADIDTTPSFHRLSPFASLRFSLTPNLSLRYFYKQTFRAPTFSELYFFNSIPRNLRPEQAHQHNLGLTWLSSHVQFTLDAYFNRIVDKIIAKPGINMFYWSMANLGLVHILGIDASTDVDIHPFYLHFNYSFAHAIDLSDPSDPKTYGYQIRYTPRHTAGGSLRFEHRWVNLSLSGIFVGHRYAYPQNNLDCRLPAYSDLTLSADRRFPLHWGTLRVQALVQNLFNTQYEVVLAYPMMGRNYRLSLSFEL